MKVLIVCTQMERAGAQKTALALATALVRAGHACTLAVLYDKAGLVQELARETGVSIIDLGMKRPGSRQTMALVWRYPRGVIRLWRLLRCERPDVLQSFCYFSNILACPLAWCARVPCRLASQRLSMEGAPGWLQRLERWVLNSPAVQRIVAVSEGTRVYAVERQGVRAAKMVVILNGVRAAAYASEGRLSAEGRAHLRAELGVAGAGPLVLLVGRLHPQKGIDVFLRALPRLRARHPDARFLIVGEGEARAVLMALAASLGVSAAVTFTGARPDVARLMALADVLVLPSRWEGLPNVLLEAMAAGLPIVATAIDGTRELIDHGRTGWLAPPDDPEALAEGLTALLSDPLLRERLAAEARRIVLERFTLDGAMRRYLALYEQAIAALGGGA